MKQRIGRILIAFGLGSLWPYIVMLFWVGLLMACYGGIDRGIRIMKPQPWSKIAIAAWCGSIAGSWAGGTVGPLAIGLNRFRRPVLRSSFLGGLCGAIHAGVVGAIFAAFQYGEKQLSLLFMVVLPLVFGVIFGAFAGRCVGWFLTEKNLPTDADPQDSSA